jgi:DNA-binding NarL/FixJ family response regulator
VKPIRILLVDDHALFRAGVRSLLRAASGLQVVAEASDGREALRLVAKRKPEVVLMDVTMPGLNGLDAAARLSTDFPDVGIVIVSMHADQAFVRRAFQSGAKGYLLKHAGGAELELAIRTVARGDTYLSRAIAKSVTRDLARRPLREDQPEEQLTPRQREILQLIAEGHTSKSIALRLRVSVKTVEAHRGRLMDRLAIRDVAGLVRWAIRNHLVASEG